MLFYALNSATAFICRCGVRRPRQCSPLILHRGGSRVGSRWEAPTGAVPRSGRWQVRRTRNVDDPALCASRWEAPTGWSYRVAKVPACVDWREAWRTDFFPCGLPAPSGEGWCGWNCIPDWVITAGDLVAKAQPFRRRLPSPIALLESVISQEGAI